MPFIFILSKIDNQEYQIHIQKYYKKLFGSFYWKNIFIITIIIEIDGNIASCIYEYAVRESPMGRVVCDDVNDLSNSSKIKKIKFFRKHY